MSELLVRLEGEQGLRAILDAGEKMGRRVVFELRGRGELEGGAARPTSSPGPRPLLNVPLLNLPPCRRLTDPPTVPCAICGLEMRPRQDRLHPLCAKHAAKFNGRCFYAKKNKRPEPNFAEFVREMLQKK